MLIGMYLSCVLSYVYAYGVGFSVVVRIKGQYQSLEERNSNSAVPLFVYVSKNNLTCVLKSNARKIVNMFS